MAQVGNFLTTKAHFKGKPKTPKPIPRPGDKPDNSKIKGRSYTRAEMRKILDSWGQGAADEFEVKEVN